VGVLVERTTRQMMLAKLADATAAYALDGFTAKLRLPSHVGKNQSTSFLNSITQCCS